MAGPFGMTRGHDALSRTIGERVPLPAVRAAAADVVVVTDGFSCQEQVRHAAGRRAIHVAEAIRMAMNTASRTEGVSR